jgi:3-oxoacyl-[acyl-carrier protein] reductase
MQQLSGRTALITGGNQGIGWAIAALFAEHGARVAVSYPDDTACPSRLAELGDGAVAFRSDASVVDEIRSLFAQVGDAFDGRLDILVNNAGIFPRNDVLDLDEATWDRVLDTNLKGTFFASQEAARLMIARGDGGRIVNLSSGGAFAAQPNSAHYSASKAGVIAVTKSFAHALAPHGIRVNAIAPGVVDTAQPRDGLSEEEIAAIAARNPLGRNGRPLDVARVALFLVGESSEWMTGQTIFLNGGAQMLP